MNVGLTNALLQTTGAIHMRKRTILSEPRWKTIPWRDIPKTPKDLLIDILVEMPTLLEDLDLMKECKDQESWKVSQYKLSQRCWDFERKLLKWQVDVGVTDPTYSLDVDHTPFSLDLVAASHIMCLYWSICIIVYGTLHIISDSHVNLSGHTDPRWYCRRIAEAVSVLLHPLSGVYGVHLTSFPVAQVLRYLNAADGPIVSKEKNMILDVFRRSGHGKTVDIFVASINATMS